MFNYVPNGLNFGSPTVQNMMQQNMVQPMPFSMAPNIGNIGAVGYNTGLNQALTYSQPLLLLILTQSLLY